MDNRCDFTAAYLGVRYLAENNKDFPTRITGQTVKSLTHIIGTTAFDRQKQVFFLFKEAADALVSIAMDTGLSHTENIISTLVRMTAHASGIRLRALSQALGRLPVTLPDRASAPTPADISPADISLDDLIAHLCRDTPDRMAWKGRSLLFTDAHGTVTGVIKFANSVSNITELLGETRWMNRLGLVHRPFSVKLPKPLEIRGKTLFKVNQTLPGGAPESVADNVCIAFIPCPGYYEYPNTPSGMWSEDRLLAVFCKNAAALGRMTRQGVIHTALIPLFHNRTQQGRRNDNGAYLWEHGGRLDQWLDSCQFPNFSASGPRDFEHMVEAEDSRSLGHYIGEHLLSFVLVIGSCFRNKDPRRRGTQNNGAPCDTRDLFCPDLFARLMERVCRSYFNALVDAPWPETFDFSVSDLVPDLVEAMGRDTHMEEFLRLGDQERMSDDEFSVFLRERGVKRSYSRGAEEIVLETGPHLGGFNQQISVPKLIDCLFRFSALCMACWYLKEKRLAQPIPETS